MCYFTSMGRGSRQLSALALKPVHAEPSQAWLDAFSWFEQKYLHPEERSTCEIHPPIGAPRFVTLSYSPVRQGVHVFSYYNTPEDLLSSMLPAIRKFTPFGGVTNVLEYQDGEFGDINNFDGDFVVEVKCAQSPCLKQVPIVEPTDSVAAEARIAHAKGVATSNPSVRDAFFSAYKGEERFLYLIRSSSGDLIFHVTATLTKVESFAGIALLYPHTFVNLYDLDAGESPVPVSFTLKYTDSEGVTYEVAEPR